MTVGESLTQARHQAGLSIDELSERTRIRETVIRSIERDQYDACGGDLYVRGYVRALAGAVGIDAQPLIREYDHVREAPGGAGPDLAATRYDLKPFPGDPEATRLDLPPVTGDPRPGDPRPGDPRPGDPRPGGPADGDQPTAEDLMAAGYELSPAGIAEPAPRAALPAPSARTGGPARTVTGRTVTGRTGAGRTRGTRRSGRGGPGTDGPGTDGTGTRHGRRRRGRGLLIGAAALVALAVIGVVGVRLASSGTSSRDTAASVRLHATPSAAASQPAAAAGNSAQPAPPTSLGRPAHQSRPARLPIQALPIAAAEAFGPDGLADGDNPGIARDAIASGAPVPWSTQWYATAEFGLLKHGTGLLLDLGRRVTITSVRVGLTGYQGADLQLRAGGTASLDDLRVAATATNAGGSLKLILRHPATARYLLVWFTQLPPNGAGEYAESVSAVRVNGHRA